MQGRFAVGVGQSFFILEEQRTLSSLDSKEGYYMENGLSKMKENSPLFLSLSGCQICHPLPSNQPPLTNPTSGKVCSGCSTVLLYPRRAANVCCSLCNAVTSVPQPVKL
ncbi:zinc finger protein [Forsythia ovata]|uniref:Zinc finger protein n=1 Tax=Forsythia ovata TaxID=205694 RepID=A0ABD1UWV2_9LAMI